MSVLKRTQKLFSRSWEDMCERFTNHQSDMKDAINEMGHSLSDLRHTTASRIADMKLLERQIKELQEGKDKWGNNAEDAVGAGRDDLALKALQQKNKISQQLDTKLSELKAMDGEVQQLKQEIKKADAKLVEFQNKATLLQHNEIFAKAGIKRTKSNVENVDSLDRRFQKMAANLENDKELKELKKPSLEDEFAALKKQAAKKVNKKEK